MKKMNYISLVLGTVGGLLFGIGMCMCMLPEWNLFKQGTMLGIAGCAVLAIMLMLRRKMEGKPAIQINAKAIGITIFAILAVLVFGLGMCMTMVWQGVMVQGIAIGMIGIFLLLCLIPLCKGLK